MVGYMDEWKIAESSRRRAADGPRETEGIARKRDGDGPVDRIEGSRTRAVSVDVKAWTIDMNGWIDAWTIDGRQAG